MQNHWLSNARGKQLLKEIDEIAMDTWGDDGTLGDFFASLSDEQTDLLFEMKIKDFVCDPIDQSCAFELKSS
jgi:hypothetical protein